MPWTKRSVDSFPGCPTIVQNTKENHPKNIAFLINYINKLWKFINELKNYLNIYK